MKHCCYQKQLPVQAERWYHMPILRDSSTQEMKRRWKERNESAGKLYFWQFPVKKGQYIPDYANHSFHLASPRNQGRIQLATVWPYSAQHTCSEVKPLVFGAWTPMIRIKPYWHKTPGLTATPPLRNRVRVFHRTYEGKRCGSTTFKIFIRDAFFKKIGTS